ncbi:MAG: hypothetical protein AAFY72_04565, partial [Cyanobacteria bacterium J06649_4]
MPVMPSEAPIEPIAPIAPADPVEPLTPLVPDAPSETELDTGDDFSPEEFSPEEFSPEDTAPENTAPENTAPENFEPENFEPENTFPEEPSPMEGSGEPSEPPLSGVSGDERLIGEGFTPFQLSYLAIGGGLEAEGIPGGDLLLQAYEAGDIEAED